MDARDDANRSERVMNVDGMSRGARDAVEMSATWMDQPIDDSDETLLDQLRRGDEPAFEMLFLRHYLPVYRVVYGVVGSVQEAEDLAQEAFMVLHRRPPRLEMGTPLIAWLCRVAVNRAYNALRSARRSDKRVLDTAEAHEAVDPSTEYLRQEERARVRAALAALPERSAKLLLLRSSGLSYAEMAAALLLAPGSIGTLLARAERAFKQVYEQDSLTGEEKK